MKQMKKIASILLLIAVVLTMTVGTAFAAGETGTEDSCRGHGSFYTGESISLRCNHSEGGRDRETGQPERAGQQLQ